MIRSIEFTLPLICLTLLLSVTLFVSPTVNAQEKSSATVGATGAIDQLQLPGSLLAAKPLTDRTPMVVRIVDSFPVGEIKTLDNGQVVQRFQYNIRYNGLEQGEYNLADWLVREDGSTTDDLPPIPVEIVSLLPPGQIEPNQLETGWLPRLGGYKQVVILVVAFWSLVLLGLIFLGRKKEIESEEPESNLSLADLLRPRLKAASENKLDSTQYAELERMLLAFWRKRLDLESMPIKEAMVQIKSHEDAGPLMKQLEVWMHSPTADSNADLSALLKPFESLPADSADFDKARIGK